MTIKFKTIIQEHSFGDRKHFPLGKNCSERNRPGKIFLPLRLTPGRFSSGLQSQPCFAGCPAWWYDYFIQKEGKDTQFSKKGGNMSIDAISSSYQAQSMSSIRSDFKNFKSDAKSLQNAISSGNQDQVSISENALAKSLSQVLGDMNGTSGAQSAAGTSGTQPSNPMQTFKADMQTLLNAVSPSAGGQNATASPSAGSAESVQLGVEHGHERPLGDAGSQSRSPSSPRGRFIRFRQPVTESDAVSFERSERAAKLPVIDVRYPKFGYRHGGEQSFEQHFHVHERAVGG